MSPPAAAAAAGCDVTGCDVTGCLLPASQELLVLFAVFFPFFLPDHHKQSVIFLNISKTNSVINEPDVINNVEFEFDNVRTSKVLSRVKIRRMFKMLFYRMRIHRKIIVYATEFICITIKKPMTSVIHKRRDATLFQFRPYIPLNASYA